MNFIENDDNDFNDSEDEISSDKIDHAKHLSKIHFFSQSKQLIKIMDIFSHPFHHKEIGENARKNNIIWNYWVRARRQDQKTF